MKQKNNMRGITLIALVITIIVLIILAAVSIATLTGDNGILTQANKAKEETELAGLVEEVELAKSAMFIENGEKESKKASEFMYYLVEQGVLKEDRFTFKNNENYTLYPNGNIMCNGEKVANVKLTENIEEREGIVVNHDTYGQFDGVGYIYDGYLSEDYNIVALEAPEGYQFGYWMNENNDIVSYEKSYNDGYIISDGIVYTQYLYAVYTKETVERKPVVSSSLSQRIPFNYEGAEKEILKIGGVYRSDNYVPKKVGIIFTMDSSYKENLTLNNVDGDIIKTVSSSKTYTVPNVVFGGSAIMGTNRFKPLYARAYATYTDATGEEITIYSNVACSEPLN